MIFGELDHFGSVDDAHDELAALLRRNFASVESGHQGDSWVWVHDGGVKVSIDTFTSMKHQVKSALPGDHVDEVLSLLGRHYRLSLMNPPVPEAHE